MVLRHFWRNTQLDKQKEKFNRPGRTSEFLLAGLVKCGCGYPMYKVSSARKFTCRKCKNTIAEETINKEYQNHLQEYLGGMSTEVFMDELNKRIAEKETLLASSIKKRTQHLKKMDDLVNLKLNDGISREHYTRIYKPLSQEVAQLEVYIPELEGEIDFVKMQVNSSDYILSQAKTLYKEWSLMDVPRKRALIETVTDYIVIEDDTIRISLSNSLSQKRTSQRGYIHALPCLHHEKRQNKPVPATYPNEPVTIGDHIRKKRMDLKLLQKGIFPCSNH